jgi:hypothetical protein
VEVMNFEIAPKETEDYLKWDDAKLYCFSLNVDGKTGWRIPTVRELREIDGISNDFRAEDYWSATTGRDFDNYAETFDFGRGYERRSDKHWCEWVRAVRSNVTGA